VTAEFVAAMEDILDLYSQEYREQFSVVCFDETSKQLIEEVRLPRRKPNASIMNTKETAWQMCLCFVNRLPVGDTLKSLSNARNATLQNR
jgi:hypothetical protein